MTKNRLYSWSRIRLDWYSIGDNRVNDSPKWFVFMDFWWVKVVINGLKIRTFKGLDISKYKNDGRTSMLVFADVTILMERSWWKSWMLTTWYPRRVRYFREHENGPHSLFCTDVKSHWSSNYWCRWSSWVNVKLLFVACYVSIVG